jgi:hypothetical protein
MADAAPLPLDSLLCVLGHIETERSLHELANDPRQYDVVYEHAGKLREWLSGPDDSEPADALLAEDAHGGEDQSSQTSAA